MRQGLSEQEWSAVWPHSIWSTRSGAIARGEMQKRGGDNAATALDIVAVFAADAADRLGISAKNALATIEGSDAAAAVDRALIELRHGPVDTIAARRRIADAVIAAGRYPL